MHGESSESSLLHDWFEASTGARGWWLHNRPENHFRTSLFTADVLAGSLIALIEEYLPGDRVTVLDLGAGSRVLTEQIADRRPRWATAAVDVRPEPAAGRGDHRPDADAGPWLVDTWDVRTTAWTSGAVDAWWAGQAGPVVVVGHEFLDELPCEIGTAPGAQDWVGRWWSSARPDLVEIGRTRDAAWADVIGRLRPQGGLAVMIDYGHLKCARPGTGTLRGFRDGRLTPPAFDGSVNLTADVAVDAVSAAAEGAGAELVWAGRQHEAATRWCPTPDGPVAGSRPDSPTDPLNELIARNRRRVFAATGAGGNPGPGEYWWLVHRVRPASAADRPVAG